ncbi:MAG: corrinoid protein [Alphaproteobacteria bacterium]|jgi:5-methyltetrahydrofolate--homocysteine methyltransferase|nr:cobalamin-binding protein [Rhodospirillaceae bacterium]MDP6404988.1 corrinoid protein [Alphaproteobacteria bacterium]MDP6620776.1 corrinoid protein [Alphaproteobacteria bacterium]|tara:strand:- start:968 stop:1603 length:636 start_codon:yes stop_codon:yes gene_type:complete
MSVSDIYTAVSEYDDEKVTELVNAEVAAGTDVQTILNDGMIAALDEIGRKFSEGTLFVPEMLMAAEAVQAGLEIIRPLLIDTGVKPVGCVVIGTVKGDLHDIGKNLVAMMLEGAGFKIVDLGTDVDADQFIDAAHENEADLIAMSGLLTTSMPEMEKAVVVIDEANSTRNMNVKVMVGGPPVSQDFAERIGASGYGIDAPGAVDLARGLVQ